MVKRERFEGTRLLHVCDKLSQELAISKIFNGLAFRALPLEFQHLGDQTIIAIYEHFIGSQFDEHQLNFFD